MHEHIDNTEQNWMLREVEAFVDNLASIDELEVNTPFHLLEAEEVALRQEKRLDFFDNMNA